MCEFEPCLSEFFSALFCFLVCTGVVFLNTVAPTLAGGNLLGVFAVGENISLLQSPNYFLPTCFHSTGKPLNMTLSKINDGAIWAQEAAVPQVPDLLVPSSAPLLAPNLTGQYQCTAPGQQDSRRQYRLDVVGKKEANLTVFFYCVKAAGPP